MNKIQEIKNARVLGGNKITRENNKIRGKITQGDKEEKCSFSCSNAHCGILLAFGNSRSGIWKASRLLRPSEEWASRETDRFRPFLPAACRCFAEEELAHK